MKKAALLIELHNMTASGILTRTFAQQLQACIQNGPKEFYMPSNQAERI